jgi:transcriptional regulator with XRE-family HTH domain
MQSIKASDRFRFNCRAHLQSKDMTVQGMCRDIGISAPSFFRFLSGKSGIGLDHADRIAGGIGVPLSDLLK